MVTDLVLVLFAVNLLELGLWLPAFWQARKLGATLFILVNLLLVIELLIVHPRLWTSVLALLGSYRMLNMARLALGRMNEQYLRQATLRTCWQITLLEVLTTLVFKIVVSLNGGSVRWLVLASLQVVLALILFASTLRHLEKTREPVVTKTYADRDLPTLTVAIPARNETEDLQASLESLIANDYPKLEIVVLDDCSSNAKTPEIIRSYAHAGVSFVEGSAPSDTWLAKNWAYERLSEAANGEIIMFCGVDTRFTPDSLRRLVTTLLEKNKTMVSILPHNENTSSKGMVVQTLRYTWELSLPRRLFQRPPVLSTCWLIKADFLKSVGGFKAVSRSIVPESYFARAAKVGDGYSFVRSNEVVSAKNYDEQVATAVRTRYPQLHRKPEQVALVTAVELFGIFAVYPLLVVGVVMGWWLVAALCFLAAVILALTYALVIKMTYGKLQAYLIALVPIVALVDVWLLHLSMWKYEFSEVVWKGRNVCIPVMHVVSSLPKLR